MTKRNRPKLHVWIRYKGKECDIRRETPDEIIAALLEWFRKNFDPEDWPYVLKWVEGIK